MKVIGGLATYWVWKTVWIPLIEECWEATKWAKSKVMKKKGRKK